MKKGTHRAIARAVAGQVSRQTVSQAAGRGQIIGHGHSGDAAEVHTSTAVERLTNRVISLNEAARTVLSRAETLVARLFGADESVKGHERVQGGGQIGEVNGALDCTSDIVDALDAALARLEAL